MVKLLEQFFALFQKPLFITDVVLTSERILLDPSLEVTLHIFNQLMDLWQDRCKVILNLIMDETFLSFTK